MTAAAVPSPVLDDALSAGVGLTEKIEAARAAATGRGYAVTFTGPAAHAHVRGCVDGFDGRLSVAATYATADEREAYEYGWHAYHRWPRDNRGLTYDCTLF